MRKQIFKAIAQRIAERCPDIKFIDLWNEHVVEVATSVPWPLPAVFIEFEQYEVRSSRDGRERPTFPCVSILSHAGRLTPLAQPTSALTQPFSTSTLSTA